MFANVKVWIIENLEFDFFYSIWIRLLIVRICLSCCFHRSVPCDLSNWLWNIYCVGFGLAQFVFCDDVRGHMRFVREQGVLDLLKRWCERPFWRCVIITSRRHGQEAMISSTIQVR